MSGKATFAMARTAALGFGYFVAVACAVAATRFDGAVASLWIATALLVARLATLPRARWWPPVIACAIGGYAASATWGAGPLIAVPLTLATTGEAVLGAWLLRRLVGARQPIESLDWLFGFVLAVGIVAPAASAMLGAPLLAQVTHTDVLRNAVRWFVAHSLGTVTFAPIAMQLMRGDWQHWRSEEVPARARETVLLLGLVAATCVLVFAQSRLPILFLPLLPIILATFRAGRLAAAASIVILTVVGGAFTAIGDGPIALLHAGAGVRMQFLQFFLAAAVLTILPVAAELERRNQLFRRLRDSEARYRLVTDHSSDIVFNLDVEGRIRFVSPSIGYYGHDPATLIGRSAAKLVDPMDVATVRLAHERALAEPNGTFIAEYRALTPHDEQRWFESHSRAVLDEKGRVAGVVSAARDVSHRKAIEDRLARAAMTDSLTGLANRRAFLAELEVRIKSGAPGCVAMFDLDHFKRVNDTYGHAAGDEVLEQFARMARAAIREDDLVARLGGEEFAVVLPGLGLEQARLVCDRLRVDLSHTALIVGSATIYVTVSGGVAAYQSQVTSERVLRAADAALYRAKAAGRDRLAIAA